MSAFPSLISELEAALQEGNAEKHGEMLRHVTTLFLEGAPYFKEDHIRLFDYVFACLVEEIETKAKADLSARLAPIPNAPLEILRRLAKDDDIVVAGPVLAQSPCLEEKDLVDIARSKGQAHLFALSSREQLNANIADILVQRGDREVVRKVAGNPGASLSETGYSNLVKRADDDGPLAETLAQRADIPKHVFRDLLMRATEVVQQRLLAAAKPETQAEIRRVLEKISGQMGASDQPKHDFSAAKATVRKAAAGAPPDEKKIAGFAAAGRYEETTVGLAAICKVPLEVVDRMMSADRPDPVLILCKAADFSWTTTRLILLVRPGTKGKSATALEEVSANYEKLSESTAQRVVHFWQAGQHLSLGLVR